MYVVKSNKPSTYGTVPCNISNEPVNLCRQAMVLSTEVIFRCLLLFSNYRIDKSITLLYYSPNFGSTKHKEIRVL